MSEKQHDTRVKEIIEQYQNEISKYSEQTPADLPIEHEIKLIDNQPVTAKYRRIPYALRDDVNKEIDRLLANKIIEPSQSCYSSPLVPIVKKNKTIRLCADFRLLNDKTLSAHYPIPHADDIFSTLRNSKVFSVIDLKNAYHQVKVKESDREKTACFSDNFKFHWIRLPFGLQGAPYTLNCHELFTFRT